METSQENRYHIGNLIEAFTIVYRLIDAHTKLGLTQISGLVGWYFWDSIRNLSSILTSSTSLRLQADWTGLKEKRLKAAVLRY